MPSEISVTIPRSAIDQARSSLGEWKAILGARVIGETKSEIGVMLTLATDTPLANQMARGDLETRLRPFRGKVGARSEWPNSPNAGQSFFEAR